MNFRNDTFSNANSYFSFTSPNYHHSCQNLFIWKAVNGPDSSKAINTIHPCPISSTLPSFGMYCTQHHSMKLHVASASSSPVGVPPIRFGIFESPHIVRGSVVHQCPLPYEFCSVDSSTLPVGVFRLKGDTYGFCGGGLIWYGDCVHFSLVLEAKMFELSRHGG